MTPLSSAERKRLEREVYRAKHRDYRSLLEGKPAILVLGPSGATTLTPLASMSDDELVAYAKRQGIEVQEATRSPRQAGGRAARCPACGHTAHHGSAGCEHVQGVNFCKCKLTQQPKGTL
jgi:hypothetical protein